MNLTPQEIFDRSTRTETGCLEWGGALRPDGYGYYSVGEYRPSGSIILRSAHRRSCELFWGPIPEGFVVMHHCDNPCCVEPLHLKATTQRENLADMTRKGRRKSVGSPRTKFHQSGAENKMAKLDEDKVSRIRGLSASGMTQRSIADLFGVSQTCIGKILRGIRWKHVGKAGN